MSKTVLTGARLFDGLNDTLAGPAEILIKGGDAADIAQDEIERAQKRMVTSKAPMACESDCGMFPFSPAYSVSGDGGGGVGAAARTVFFSPDVSVLPASRHVTWGLLG